MKSDAPRAVGDLLAGAMPQLEERLGEHRLGRSWVAIVGAEVARRARPGSLTNGVLQIVVDNSPWLCELTLRAAELTRRVRAEVPGVRALRFTLGALPGPDVDRPPPPSPRAHDHALTPHDVAEIDSATASIADPAVASAARRLLMAARRSSLTRGDR
jgi:hypothetical protein